MKIIRKPIKKNSYQKKSLKRKIIGGLSAIGVGAGVFLASIFGSADELTQRNLDRIDNQDQAPMEVVIDAETAETLGSSDEDNDDESKGSGIRFRIRKFIRKIPVGVRYVVGLPLWAAGWCVIHLLGLLLQAVGMPVLNAVISCLLAAAAIIGTFVFAVKCVFPDMPLRKILRWRNIKWLLLGTAILILLDRISAVVWPEYARLRTILMFAGGLVVLAAAGIPFILKESKRRKAAEEKLRLRKMQEEEEERMNGILPDRPVMVTIDDVKYIEDSSLQTEER